MHADPNSSKITVIVPVHNAAGTLRQCVHALKEQTDSNYEVIVVDDHSNDDSPHICKESGFKVLRLAVNKGQAVARNAGVKEATGQIIAFVDSDVVVPPDWLARYRQLLNKYQDADMICSGYSENVGNDKPAMFAFYESVYRRMKIPMYISSSTSSNCIIYKEAFDEVGGYPEYYIKPKKNVAEQKAVATTEDSELGFLLSVKGKKIVWSHDNPVRHYFRKTWGGYIKQQAGFSRYAVLSLFKFPKKIYSIPIYGGEKITPNLAIASVMVSALFIPFFGVSAISVACSVIIEIVCILSVYILNRGFIGYLKVNMKDCSYPQLLFWIAVSRIAWLYGVILGVKDGCVMWWYNRTKGIA